MAQPGNNHYSHYMELPLTYHYWSSNGPKMLTQNWNLMYDIISWAHVDNLARNLDSAMGMAAILFESSSS